MDKIDIKELLKNTFGDKFHFHPKFYEEFAELTKKSGVEQKIVRLFVRRLSAISQLKDIDCGLSWLEHLKMYDNMYSLHVDTNEKNYRLLFSQNSKGKYFLHMFYEKSGKKNTSYAKHVPIAIQRREDN